MPFNRPNPPPPLSMDDDKYLNQQLSPMSRPLDPFSVTKGPGAEPLTGNWSYDSAIDLFSLTPADMDRVPFDFADGLANTDTKDLFMDPFGSSNTINGFTMPAAEDSVSLSSDLDSDDQSWPNNIPSTLDMKTEQPPNNNPSTSLPRTSTSTTSTRWSSSPELQPQEYLAPKQPTTTIKPSPPAHRTRTQTTPTTRKPRSLSQDSSHSNTSNSTTSPPQVQVQNQSQDPTTRNAAKRAAHNIIEKRYRTNMNAKFLALERAISPSGSGVHKPSSRGGAGSLKKSEILTNALAYIEGVQQENLALKKEVALLRGERGLVSGGGWRGSKGRC